MIQRSQKEQSELVKKLESLFETVMILLTQVRRYKDAKEVHSDCKDNDRPEHDSDYKGYQ